MQELAFPKTFWDFYSFYPTKGTEELEAEAPTAWSTFLIWFCCIPTTQSQ